MYFGGVGWFMRPAVRALPIVLGLLTPTMVAQAQSGAVKAAFEKFDLLGTLSTDCKSNSPKDGFLINRAIDADYVEVDRMINAQNREFAAMIGKADVKGNEIAVSYTVNDAPFTATLRVERGRMRWFELARNGEKLVTAGRTTNRGIETKWYSKCAMNVVIQAAPNAGGKCLDVPFAQFKAGARLQVYDCNDGPAQTFTFDALNGSLTIGGFCVESAKAGDQLQLARCTGASNQTWKTGASGSFVKFLGLNDLCADIANASKENRAAVGTWKCHAGANQSWILRSGLNLAIDEKTNREGDTIREFNLSSADVKLCQQACIDEKRCSGWVYRGPGGRTDKQPHCWLRYNISEAKPSDKDNASGAVRPDAAK